MNTKLCTRCRKEKKGELLRFNVQAQENSSKSLIEKEGKQVKYRYQMKEEPKEQQEEELDEKKKLKPNKNVIERLVKLDKKNSNFNIFDYQLKKKLKIRNNIVKSSAIFSSIPPPSENGLKMFWRHISEYYFRRIESPEVERLDYITLILTLPLPECKRGYVDYQNYWAVKDILSPKIKSLYTDKLIAQKNYDNILKHIQIMTRLHKIIRENSNSLEDENFLNKCLQAKYMRRGNIDVANFLEQESKNLNDYLRLIEEESGEEENQIQREIRLLEKEWKTINHTNLSKISELKKKVTKEMNSPGCAMEVQNKFDLLVFGDKLSITKNRKQGGYESKESLDLQVSYIKNLILKLESKQLSESISNISDAKKRKKNEIQYELRYEDTLQAKENWINEELLTELDNHRENSLFTYYNIPQKGFFSFISQNFYGFQTILGSNRNNIKVKKGESSYGPLKKKAQESVNSISNDKLKREMEDFTICHHCKNFFSNPNLISCNYRSSTMGLPVLNTLYADPILLENQNTPRRRGLNSGSRKRSTFTPFSKPGGELFCHRKFCRFCLKQNYDLNLNEVLSKPDYICPFCQGICYCSRCLRNDMILRLKTMYLHFGGDLSDISKDSMLDRYVTNKTEEQKKRITFQQNTSQPLRLLSRKLKHKKKSVTKHVKQKIKELAALKKMRSNMEKLGILLSQVTKREKKKQKLEQLDQDIFEMKCKHIFSNVTPTKTRSPSDESLPASSQKEGSQAKIKNNRNKLEKFSILNQKKLLNSESSFDTIQTIISEKERESKRIRNELDNIFEDSEEEAGLGPDIIDLGLEFPKTEEASVILIDSNLAHLPQKPLRGRRPLKNKILVGVKRKASGNKLEKVEKKYQKFIRRQSRQKVIKTSEEDGKTSPVNQKVDQAKKINYLMQKLSPLSKNVKTNPENPNEPSDNIHKSRNNFMKTELTRLMSHQNPNQYALLINTINSDSRNINKKLLRSEKTLKKRKLKKLKKNSE